MNKEELLARLTDIEWDDFEVKEARSALPIEVLLKKDISLPRNPVIAKLFRCVRLAENAGYGFNKILKWEEATNIKIVFEKDRTKVA